ncbi:MAG TPA: COX15/CtaA family protein [Acidobacteriaceae bacterium]|nr:COX15/CtaA family protein [Acidobacteriaceae bacterium]
MTSTLSTRSPSHTRTSTSTPPALRRFAWFLLAYNVLVILWGTLVRATGSGGGCGDHWPLCNGVVLPQIARFHTMVEFTHRLMSGATLFLIVALLVWVWKAMPRGQLARGFAVAAMILVLNEALLGALLVKLGLVGQNASIFRAFYLGLHLTNTLLLLAALALTAEFLSHSRDRATTSLRRGQLTFPTLGILATLVVGVSGSLAALGDTLFPSSSLSNALHQDFSSAAPWLLRLRWVHPASAVIAGALILWLLVQAFRPAASSRLRSLGIAVLCTLLAQYALGVADVLLRAPTWLQIVHLLDADIFWIFLVLLTAEFCFVDAPRTVETLAA